MKAPAEADLRPRLLAFLTAHSTMALATIGPTREPQVAPVFYAADADLNLVFLSSPDSRHSQNLDREPRVAAAIYADGQAWQSIQGLQIEGTARPVEGMRASARAARIFAVRFDFLKNLLADDAAGLPLELRGPVASSRFYSLKPAWIRLVDNSLGFGHREEWHAEA